MTDIAEPMELATSFHVFSAKPGEVRFSYSRPEDMFWERLAIRTLNASQASHGSSGFIKAGPPIRCGAKAFSQQPCA
jgi:hypothetical protein